MPTEIRIPQLSLTMTEGRVSRWFKREGEHVTKGEPLFELETDKVVTDVNAPATGTLTGVGVADGDSAPVLAVVGFVVAAGESASTASIASIASIASVASIATTAPDAVPSVARTDPPASSVLSVASEAGNGQRLFISPRARKLAAAEGIALDSLRGTGPGGRVMEKDVVRAIDERARETTTDAPLRPETPPSALSAASGAYSAVPLRGIRATIAQRMKASQNVTAAVTLTAEVDVSEAAKLRQQANAEWARGGLGKLTYTDVVVKSVAKALREHPDLNSSLVSGESGDEVRRHDSVNVGVAVSLTDAGGEGLIVPVVRAADTLSLLEVSRTVRDLSERARTGSLRPDEVSGGTFTVSNMGMLGVEVFTPIINWPECAILGVGRIADRAVVRDGVVVVRPTLWLSLSFDHRIVDGAPAAAFLSRIKDLLESPYLLFV